MNVPTLRAGNARRTVLAVVCVAVLTLGFATHSATPISASKWVTAVCKAEKKLNSAVQSRFNTLNAEASAGDVAALKTGFVALVGALPGPTKTLLSSLQKAGVPKVTNGKQIAATYVSTVQSVGKQLPTLKANVEAIPVSDFNTFMAALDTALTPLMTTTTAGDQKVQSLDTNGKVATPLNNCGGVFAAGGGQSSSNNSASGGSSGSGSSGSGSNGSGSSGSGSGSNAGTPATTAPSGGTSAPPTAR